MENLSSLLRIWNICITLDWTYSDVPESDESEADTYVSNLLDFYGYLLYFSPLIAAIPGLIFKMITHFTGSKFKGDFWGLVIIMAYTAISCAVCSAQMCYQAEDVDDKANSIAFVMIFSITKTVLYATPGVVSQSQLGHF